MKKPCKIPGTNKFNINSDQVMQLATRFWTNVEIAAFFGVDEGTIRKRFSEILTKAREVGKGKLRDLQWRAAEKGNAALLIWLRKQYLSQSDKGDFEDERLLNSEIEFSDVPEISREEVEKRFARFIYK